MAGLSEMHFLVSSWHYTRSKVQVMRHCSANCHHVFSQWRRMEGEALCQHGSSVSVYYLRHPIFSGNHSVQEVSNVPSPSGASHLSLMGFAVQTNSWAICGVDFSSQPWDCCWPCITNAHSHLLHHHLGEGSVYEEGCLSFCKTVA